MKQESKVIRYGSVCSGIEAATSAWHHLGWAPSFFSEIEAFPRAVLAHRYPNVPLHGDFTTIQENDYEPIDLLVGGTPCQSFSVAGLRGGLDDERGNLALEFCRLAQRLRPRWIVWENVPGVLSSGGGRDFGSILGALEELGYGLAYRVLDAQYFGVAQRRRRVFVVGYLGDWRRAAAVLFERHSMSGHPAPRRKTGQDTAEAAAEGAGERGVAGREGPAVGWPADVACTLDTDFGSKWGQNNQHVNAGCPLFVSDSVGTLRTKRPGEGGVQGDFDHIVPAVSPALNTQSGSHHAPDTKAYVAYSIMPMNSGKDYKARETEVAQPLMAAGPVSGNQGGDFVMAPAVAFAQNTRDEVRLINGDGQIVGALAAQPGMKQTSYVAFGAGGNPPATAFAIQAGALRENPNSGPDGVGVQAEHAYTLEARAEVQAVAHSIRLANTSSNGWGVQEEVTRTLDRTSGPAVQTASAVRRLTPIECERLQGFPDNFTAIPWKKKGPEDCPDGPRYKALGNSMAVPVMRWIGERIQMVDALEDKA